VNDAHTRPPAAPTPQELLNAYAFGAFPMDAPEHADERVPYYEADPRAVIPVGEFRTPRSVARGIARAVFDIRVNTAFAAVCRACGARPEGTWLSPRLVDAYCRLHAAGYAHSVEAWERQRLVGGLFGVALGGLFTSESMFHTASDAGNAVLVATARRLAEQGYVLWDIQMATEHTLRFGTELIPREEYLARLHKALRLERSFAGTQRLGLVNNVPSCDT
jgi:leucyl/phenylalanyl-tRNA--protein transferase